MDEIVHLNELDNDNIQLLPDEVPRRIMNHNFGRGDEILDYILCYKEGNEEDTNIRTFYLDILASYYHLKLETVETKDVRQVNCLLCAKRVWNV